MAIIETFTTHQPIVNTYCTVRRQLCLIETGISIVCIKAKQPTGIGSPLLLNKKSLPMKSFLSSGRNINYLTFSSSLKTMTSHYVNVDIYRISFFRLTQLALKINFFFHSHIDVFTSIWLLSIGLFSRKNKDNVASCNFSHCATVRITGSWRRKFG